MYVYFLKEDEGERVKIGYTSNISSRISILKCTNSRKVQLIRALDGDIEIEKWFHEKFSHLRIKNDWFNFVPEMMTDKPIGVKEYVKPTKPIREIKANKKIKRALLLVDEPMFKWLKAYAREHDISISHFIRSLIVEKRKANAKR